MINLELINTSSFFDMLGVKSKVGARGSGVVEQSCLSATCDGCHLSIILRIRRLFCLMMFRQPLASGFRLSTSSNSLHPGVWTGIDRPRLTGINDEIWGGGGVTLLWTGILSKERRSSNTRDCSMLRKDRTSSNIFMLSLLYPL